MRIRFIYICTLATVACVSTAGLHAAVRRSGLFDRDALIQDVALDISSPHIPWANPLHQGPIRGLFVGPMYGHRETVELAQRLELNFDVVFAGTTSKWQQYGSMVGYSRPEYVIDRLRAKLKDRWDIIVIGNLDWSLLPSDVVYAMFEQVSQGSGLIYVMYEQSFPESLRALLDAEPTPPPADMLIPCEAFTGVLDRNGNAALVASPQARYYRFGAGKVALVRYPGCPTKGVHYLTPDPYHPLAYEYCQAYLIKTILHVTGRSDAGRIQEIRIDDCVEFAENASADSTVVLVPALLTGDIELTWCVRSASGSTQAQGMTTLPGGSPNLVTIDIPPTPDGRHFLEVSVARDGEVIDFASSVFQVSSPWFISGIDLLDDTVDQDAYVSGQVLVNVLPDDAYVVVRLYDNHGRQCAEARLPDKRFVQQLYTFSSSGSLWFRLPVADSLTTINTVVAELHVDGRIVSRREKECYVPRRPPDDFLLGVWGAAERLSHWSHVQELVCRREKQLGIDLELVGHYYNRPQTHLANVAGITRCNLYAYPYVDRVSYFGTDRIRQPCLTDPAFLKVKFDRLSDWATSLRKFGCFAYNLGDENNLSARGVDVCVSPTCLNHFRQWLQDQYSSLDHLNREWDTDFETWEQVVPPTHREAQRRNNLAGWIDHRVFMTDVMMEYMAKDTAAIQRADPGAPCGPEGIWGSSPYYGFDWYQLAETCQIVFPYFDEPVAFNAARSLAKPTTVTGIWAGGYPPRCLIEPMARYDPWMAILNSMRTLWFYAAYDGNTLMTNYNALSPDLRLNRSGVWFFEETDRIRRGVGKLILHSSRCNDGVALLFSKVSSYLVGASAANDMIKIIHDAGYQFDLVTPQQVTQGVLEQFKCLLLPGCCALSDKEAEQIRKFVECGGVVLADTVPGTHSIHGRRLEKASLSSLFGVTEVSGDGSPAGGELGEIPAFAEVDVTDSQPARKKSTATIRSSVEPGDLAIEIGTARFADDVAVQHRIGGIPVVARHEYGEGTAVCLNFRTKQYSDYREYGKQGRLPQLLRTLLSDAGITPGVTVLHEDGQAFRQGVAVVRFGFEGGFLVALLREELSGVVNPPVAATVDLGNDYHVYEFESGRYFGYVRNIPITLASGPPVILFALQTKPGSMHVSASAAVARGGRLVIDVQVAGQPFSVCHVELIDPDGFRKPYYTGNELLRDGHLRIERALAQNEKVGPWTAVVDNVITSQQHEVSFTVNQGSN